MPSPRRPWLKWLLVASLALNLGFAGLIAGAVFKGPPPPPWPGIGLLQYARGLPEPYRRDLGKALRDARPEWTRSRAALRDQREALVAALVSDPYDAAAVRDLLAREAAATGELSSLGADLLTAQIERMRPDERAAYAAALGRDRGPHGDGPRGGGPHGGGPKDR